MAWSRLSMAAATAATLVATGLVGGMTQVAVAQDSLAPITFTTSQAGRGKAAYGSNDCTSCHGAKLEGLDGGPPLSGESFQANWFGGSVADLYTFILENMPASNPGSLKPDQAQSIVAFIAQSNGLTAGDVELPADPAELAKLGFKQ